MTTKYAEHTALSFLLLSVHSTQAPIVLRKQPGLKSADVGDKRQLHDALMDVTHNTTACLPLQLFWPLMFPLNTYNSTSCPTSYPYHYSSFNRPLSPLLLYPKHPCSVPLSPLFALSILQVS